MEQITYKCNSNEKIKRGGSMTLERIREIRNRLGLSQSELGKHLGVKKSTISRWETKEEIIPLKHLVSFCNYVEVNIDYVLGITDEKKKVTKIRTSDKLCIGKNLVLLRRVKKITQKDIAKTLNTTQSTISAYENGKTTLLTAFLYDLCTRYKVSADWFCDTNEL